MTPNDISIVESSFRDPSGFVFFKGDTLYRQVNKAYRGDYDHLMSSGLYDSLVSSGLMVSHKEADLDIALSDSAYKVIEPDQIGFISYPYEWSFSQFRDAALTTLAIQKKAFEFGMTLKDSSVYNIQFTNCNPVFIDTLSFEKYRRGQLWAAYKQFCQHFLAPLALMSYTDIRLSSLMSDYIDGIPLCLASKLLPFRSYLKFSIFSHIHLHAKTQKKYSGKQIDVKSRKISSFNFRALIENLESAVKKLKWSPAGTEWGDYYDATNYSEEAMGEKEKLVFDFIDRIKPRTTWDLGANTGVFSRLASRAGSRTVAFDIDPAAVEKNYLHGKANDKYPVLPLVLDLTNPSSSIGWNNNERMSILDRGPVDAVMALALVHHLAISNNLPLEKIASFLSSICRSLIIEFVPKEDSQVQRLLATREDIFPGYTYPDFEETFKRFFIIQDSVKIADSHRTLYLMQRKANE